jgi:predicted RNase H-like HicB family nuclease
MKEYTVLLIWDDEARVWVASNDEIPITLEVGSLDLLMERVRIAAPELLELNGKESKEVYLNFTVQRRAKVIA